MFCRISLARQALKPAPSSVRSKCPRTGSRRCFSFHARPASCSSIMPRIEWISLSTLSVSMVAVVWAALPGVAVSLADSSSSGALTVAAAASGGRSGTRCTMGRVLALGLGLGPGSSIVATISTPSAVTRFEITKASGLSRSRNRRNASRLEGATTVQVAWPGSGGVLKLFLQCWR